jgi:hypothetical protein
MFDKRAVLLVATFLFMTIHARAEGIEKETITGEVAAYDVGIELASSQCRQTLIVRAKTPARQGNEYIIVRYENSCMKLIPERVIKKRQQWRFSLTRDVACDERLDDLLYIKNPNEEGGTSLTPFMKFMPGVGREKIATDRKLPCYVLRPGDFDPPLKERLITGLVVSREGRIVSGAYVEIKYADGNPSSFVFTDKQGQFTIPAYEGLEYVIQARTTIDGRLALAGLVHIPATGEIKPLRLVIK